MAACSATEPEQDELECRPVQPGCRLEERAIAPTESAAGWPAPVELFRDLVEHRAGTVAYESEASDRAPVAARVELTLHANPDQASIVERVSEPAPGEKTPCEEYVLASFRVGLHVDDLPPSFTTAKARLRREDLLSLRFRLDAALRRALLLDEQLDGDAYLELKLDAAIPRQNAKATVRLVDLQRRERRTPLAELLFE